MTKRRTFLLLLAWMVAVPAWLLAAVCVWNYLQRPTPLRPPIQDVVAAPDLSSLRDCTCTISSGEEARYVLYVPPDYDPAKPCPLIVFLHGYGKRGNDGRHHLQDGLAPALCYWAGWREHCHFLVLFSQGRSGNWLPGSADDELVMSELADVQAHYAVDAARIYLTGISSGGTGTWELAVAHPDLWAAIVPVCGMCKPEDAARLRHIPCWCFHGEADQVAPPEQPREMMRRLLAEGATPRYTEYAGRNHGIWDSVYRSAELYDWLLQQHRE
jgi:predicted peptidase